MDIVDSDMFINIHVGIYIWKLIHIYLSSITFTKFKRKHFHYF